MRDAVLEATGVDLAAEPSREHLAAALAIEATEELGWGKLVDMLLSKRVEPGLIQPTFILDYPVEVSPFAKRHRATPGVVERWEAFVGGLEIANAFSELNDPDEQRRRFDQQAAELRRGDAEAQPHDESYLQALEQGMPPTAGVGLGIDRLVMIDRSPEPARGPALPGDASGGERGRTHRSRNLRDSRSRPGGASQAPPPRYTSRSAPTTTGGLIDRRANCRRV